MATVKAAPTTAAAVEKAVPAAVSLLQNQDRVSERQCIRIGGVLET